ncbi:hypothetical protein EHQ53_04755 [Leptospira langatensis]|uniref:Uncharacterized protein n=1 Tax=Leptospira langatensis TaxID=2484983 RepID=A0A5F1ZVP0_9LEPT|nr:hypothetical protein [Leptospira langatensis]TGK00130.1 hypothetical protein EHO57_12620 [Leptospira langatensis]TGL42764.1 hypothetical protein EHQ53_04755 [Leptospira langatensis]
MKIVCQLIDFNFYFSFPKLREGLVNTEIIENASLLLDSREEWIGIHIEKHEPTYIYWVNSPIIASSRIQEVYVDYLENKIIGIEINLWIENRDIRLDCLIKAMGENN